MKNSIFIYILLFASFSSIGQVALTENEIQTINKQLDIIAEKDQQYRSVISLGTLNENVIATDKAMRDTASIDVYLSFLKSVKKDLSDMQKDSLWNLQHKLDFENYQSFKDIVDAYGYPSKERLGANADRLYAVLLHPPVSIDVKLYQQEMMNILLPELTLNNIKAESIASFYDNMQTKILNEPQLYGTVKLFDMKTMTQSVPKIENIDATNKARIKLGLSPLSDGEFALLDN